MTLAAGTRLGRYEIRSKIGAAGMGEVYLAHEQRQVMIEPISQETPKQINVVLNWFEELNARVPSN